MGNTHVRGPVAVLSARAGYGTQPEVIAALVHTVGEAAAVVLSYDEDRTVAALGLNRFGTIGSTRLDWRGAEVLERSAAFDAAQLRDLLRRHTQPGETAVVFWGNLAVPSVALDAGLLAAHADTVLECCHECWVHLLDAGLLIEFQDGEGFTVGRVPRS
ncbi:MULTISPECIES: hypothetical protein [unclassified Streptomyces]|uniref:hypothetical protein n=1 Tax=unclassified Streptomyces TaxID=2593676 RepID=UPI002366A7AB|nr:MULTISPECIES: hypothetical protein [unclassified Streptomyces]MDF3144261.1 hypothetical protein [Streptomyces sp. T21Q-yed]WDF37814.1 hypothetical protein PBV52_13860 [Streptomyces sp. T12]